MGGSFTPVKGTAGPTTNPSYFPYVPNNYNMLVPFHCDNNVFKSDVMDSNLNGANFGNQWVIYNTLWQVGANVLTASFGAAATAPDGTTNAVHLTEGTNNGVHRIVAGYSCGVGQASNASGINTPGYKIRFAAFLKAAERTRAAMYVYGSTTGEPTVEGVKAVFDLANGAVAVQPTYFHGGTIAGYATAGTATIINYGSGWYLCYFDVFVGLGRVGNGFGVLCSIFTDNGAGNAAESTSYVGDGSSGILVWRTNCMPSSAWRMSGNMTFSDEFNDLSGFDLLKTQGPGFKWYILGPTPCPYSSDGPLVPTPLPGSFNFFGCQVDYPISGLAITTLSGQPVLSIGGTNPGIAFSTVFPIGTGPGQQVGGFTFAPPYIVEMHHTNDLGFTFSLASGGQSIWVQGMMNLTTAFFTRHDQGICSSFGIDSTLQQTGVRCAGFEWDFNENGVATGPSIGGAGGTFIIPGPDGVAGGSESLGNGSGLMRVFNGFPVWNAAQEYSANVSIVAFNGNLYQCIQHDGNPPPAHQPDISPTFYTLIGNAASLKRLVYDCQNVLQSCTSLHLPYTADDFTGFCMNFHNGVMVQVETTYIGSSGGRTQGGMFVYTPFPVVGAQFNHNYLGDIFALACSHESMDDPARVLERLNVGSPHGANYYYDYIRIRK